jgi:glycine cleavage system transcriptional repressor
VLEFDAFMQTTSNMNNNHLVITALTKSSIDAASKLATIIGECGCNIITNRMVVMGQECMVSMQVVGNWSSIAKLEHSLPLLEKKHGFALLARRTEPRSYEQPVLLYTIQVVGIDKPEIALQMFNFCVAERVQVQEAYGDSYLANQTGTRMLTLTMIIAIPGDIPIFELRERFLILCDQLNLDAIMEPHKS